MHFCILSHHRSGSNFLTDVMQEHPAISVIDEPFSMHTPLFPQLDLIRWGPDDFLADGWHGSLVDRPGVVGFLASLFAYLKGAPLGTSRGFKETGMTEKLGWLQRAIPSLKVIYLCRDPRAVVRSVLRHRARRQWRYELVVPRYARHYPDVPFAIETGDEIGRCISSWQIRHFEACRSLAEGEHCTVRLEDLVRRPQATLDRIMNLLGLAIDDRQLDFIRASQEERRGGPYSTFRRAEDVLSGWRSELGVHERRRVEGQLHDEMRNLGYL
jgi:Sulfotransferase family